MLLSRWDAGFKKVGFTRLMQHALGYSLAEAKRVTDTMINGEPVTVNVPEANLDHLIASMSELGARCAIATPIH